MIGSLTTATVGMSRAPLALKRDLAPTSTQWVGRLSAHFEWRQLLECEQDLDAPGLSRLASNQAAALELDDHPVDTGWRDLEVTLQVDFGWRTTVELRVSVDESQVLAPAAR